MEAPSSQLSENGAMDTGSSFLPQELLDLIVDECFDDSDALCALSLTSRPLLLRSRHHLFHLIDAVMDLEPCAESDCDSDEEITKRFRKPRRLQSKSLLSFLQVLELSTVSKNDPQIFIGHFVKKLRLHRGTEVSLVTLLPALRLLQNLRSLVFKHLNFASPGYGPYDNEPNSEYWSEPIFDTLDELHFEGCTFSRADDVLGFIRLCHSVQSLLIFPIQADPSSSDSHDPAQSFSDAPTISDETATYQDALRCVRIDGMTYMSEHFPLASQFMRVFIRTLDPRSLTNLILKISITPEDDKPTCDATYNMLATASAPNLKSLTIWVALFTNIDTAPSWRPPALLKSHLNLADCTQLESVWINLIPRYERGPVLWPSTFHILSPFVAPLYSSMLGSPTSRAYETSYALATITVRIYIIQASLAKDQLEDTFSDHGWSILGQVLDQRNIAGSRGDRASFQLLVELMDTRLLAEDDTEFIKACLKKVAIDDFEIVVSEKHLR